MGAIFDTVWQFNIQISALLVGLLSVRWLLRKSAKIYNAYLLWLFLPLAPIFAQISYAFAPSPERIIVLKNFAAPLLGTRTVAENMARVFPQAPTSASINWYSSPTLTESLLFLWVAGSLFFLARLARQHHQLRIELSTAPFQHSLNQNLLQGQTYPIKGVSKEGFSPSVYGFFRPNIYFPTTLYEELNTQQRSLILQHEEQHIKQGHLWLNLVWDVLVCCLWFNPLLYWSRHAFRHDQELFCDHLVLHNTDHQSHKAYGHALISTVSATHSVSLLCSWKMFNHLEERILNIKSNHQPYKKTILSVSIAALLTLSSLVAIATTEDSNKEKANESKPKSISIVTIDTDDIQQITIKADDKTYRLDDGVSSIIEGEKHRELTREEEAHFEDLVEKSIRYASATGSDKGGIFEHQNVHSFTFDHDGDLDLDELERHLENLEPMAPIAPISTKNVKVVTMVNRVSDTDREIEHALKRAEKSEKAAVRKARKRLEKTQSELASRRKALNKQRELAQKQLQELRELTEERDIVRQQLQHSKMRASKTPN